MERRVIELTLRHPWTLSRGTSVAKTNVLTRLRDGGWEGWGEAAPNARYREDAASVLRALDRLEPLLADLSRWQEIVDRLPAAAPSDRAARAAVDMALYDLAGRRAGVPVWKMLGADPTRMPPTSYSIGLDAIPVMQEKAREAEAFRILKVKVGGPDDRAILEAIRRVTDRPLYADANEGWADADTAVERIRMMEGLGVVLVEQPLPAGDLDGARRVRDRVSMPIFADEAAVDEEDLAALAGAYDGVNVKVQKAGGLGAARRMVDAARARGLRVMIGCMIETSLGITAAAHLAPLADHADLDGHLLIRGDPFRGVALREGRLVLPEGPGLGVEGDF